MKIEWTEIYKLSSQLNFYKFHNKKWEMKISYADKDCSHSSLLPWAREVSLF